MRFKACEPAISGSELEVHIHYTSKSATVCECTLKEKKRVNIQLAKLPSHMYTSVPEGYRILKYERISAIPIKGVLFTPSSMEVTLYSLNKVPSKLPSVLPDMGGHREPSPLLCERCWWLPEPPFSDRSAMPIKGVLLHPQA